MKILLDENIPVKVKIDFGTTIEVKTVKELGWLGKKNGELLGLMTFNGFDYFITLDKNLKHQQNLEKFDIKIILLLANDNKHQTIQPFVQKIKAIVEEAKSIKFHEVKL